MTKWMRIILPVGLVLIAYCKEKTPAVEKPAEPQSSVGLTGDALKKQLIAAEQWGPEFDSFGYYLSFTDSEYLINGVGPGGRRCTGKFSINNQAVQLEAGKDESGESTEQCIRQSCRVVATPNSLYASEAIGCGKDLYYNHKKMQPANKEVKIDGHDAVLMGLKMASATEAVVFRAGPNKSSGAIKCVGLEGAQPLKEFQLVARTKEKAQVDKWNNYWYYVFVQVSEVSGCDKSFGWVFGEFVKLNP